MLKKYSFFLAVLLLGIICLAPIMAQEEYITLETLGITPFAQDTAVEIDGIAFNILKGYGEYSERAFDNETIQMGDEKYIQSRHEYKNDDLNSISIVVYHEENFSEDSIDDIYIGDNTVKKTINGHTGYLGHDDDSYTFKYMKDRKVIVLTVDDESILPSVIV